MERGWGKCTVKPHYNGFEVTKHSYLKLRKSMIASIQIKTNRCQGTRAKSAIARFLITLRSVISGFYCIFSRRRMTRSNSIMFLEYGFFFFSTVHCSAMMREEHLEEDFCFVDSQTCGEVFDHCSPLK